MPNPTYFIGEGKVEELKPLIEELNADAIIFDEELSPAQTRNLEQAFDIAAIDRTGLILQVFAQRALTKEARLQVALHSSNMRCHASHGCGHTFRDLRQVVGVVDTFGVPGETQLEMDRRWVRRNIGQVRKALQAVEKQRTVQRRNRSEKVKVSLCRIYQCRKIDTFQLFDR